MVSPPEVEIRIEVPRGSFVKRDATGRVEFVSPLPCPFNYGAAPALRGGDGEALDAVVLGPRLGAGACVRVPVQALVRFMDAGVSDNKLICAARPPGSLARLGVLAFFHFYATAKRVLRAGRGGRTACDGWGDPLQAAAGVERGDDDDGDQPPSAA